MGSGSKIDSKMIGGKQKRPNIGTAGFTLVEVLVALAVSALVLGVVLRTLSLQTVGIKTALSDYQALVSASCGLERFMRGELLGDRYNGYEYKISRKVVPADPRIEEVRFSLQGDKFVEVRAYRLRVKYPINQSPSDEGDDKK